VSSLRHSKLIYTIDVFGVTHKLVSVSFCPTEKSFIAVAQGEGSMGEPRRRSADRDEFPQFSCLREIGGFKQGDGNHWAGLRSGCRSAFCVGFNAAALVGQDVRTEFPALVVLEDGPGTHFRGAALLSARVPRPGLAGRRHRNKPEARATGCSAKAERKASLADRRRPVPHRERSPGHLKKRQITYDKEL